MSMFETNFFRKFNFTDQQIATYLDSARKKLLIAEQFRNTEVRFKFSYDALVKLTVKLCAFKGYKLKVYTDIM